MFQKSKWLLTLSALLVVAVQGVAFALMSLDIVTVDRAKELGLQISANAAGPKAVRIELEFQAKDKLEGFERVDLIVEEGTLRLHSTLQDESPSPETVKVGFAVDRENLKSLKLRVVCRHGERTLVGHDISVKDFVDLGAIK
jgi:hypothetical protein